MEIVITRTNFSRRNFLKVAGFSAVAVCGGCTEQLISADADKKRPNVILFFTDDQGTLDVNCYGSKDLYTPAMDKLAKTGVRFTQAYAHIVCCPARAMLMTGRYPQRGNVNHWTQGNAKDEKRRNMFRERKSPSPKCSPVPVTRPRCLASGTWGLISTMD